MSAEEAAASDATAVVAPDGFAGATVRPADVVRHAHRCRVAGDYLGLEANVLSEHREAVSDLVRATDRLMAADAELRETVIRRLGHAAAIRVDRSDAVNAIGVFSQDVKVIDERIEGDRATVTIQVAGRVPLEPVDLVRREGRWLVQTDPPIPGVAERIRELAEVLSAVARRVDRGEVSDAALQGELNAQTAPVLRRLHALTGDRRS